MKNTAKAKGCPFCGSDLVEIRYEFCIVKVNCHNCYAQFQFVAETRERFLEKWNRRSETGILKNIKV